MKNGNLRTNYKLVGHRQTRTPPDCTWNALQCNSIAVFVLGGTNCCTVCPGNTLFATMKSWPQYVRMIRYSDLKTKKK